MHCNALQALAHKVHAAAETADTEQIYVRATATTLGLQPYEPLLPAAAAADDERQGEGVTQVEAADTHQI